MEAIGTGRQSWPPFADFTNAIDAAIRQRNARSNPSTAQSLAMGQQLWASVSWRCRLGHEAEVFVQHWHVLGTVVDAGLHVEPAGD